MEDEFCLGKVVVHPVLERCLLARKCLKLFHGLLSSEAKQKEQNPSDKLRESSTFVDGSTCCDNLARSGGSRP